MTGATRASAIVAVAKTATLWIVARVLHVATQAAAGKCRHGSSPQINLTVTRKLQVISYRGIERLQHIEYIGIIARHPDPDERRQ